MQEPSVDKLPTLMDSNVLKKDSQSLKTFLTKRGFAAVKSYGGEWLSSYRGNKICSLMDYEAYDNEPNQIEPVWKTLDIMIGEECYSRPFIPFLKGYPNTTRIVIHTARRLLNEFYFKKMSISRRSLEAKHLLVRAWNLSREEIERMRQPNSMQQVIYSYILPNKRSNLLYHHDLYHESDLKEELNLLKTIHDFNWIQVCLVENFYPDSMKRISWYYDCYLLKEADGWRHTRESD